LCKKEQIVKAGSTSSWKVIKTWHQRRTALRKKGDENRLRAITFKEEKKGSEEGMPVEFYRKERRSGNLKALLGHDSLRGKEKRKRLNLKVNTLGRERQSLRLGTWRPAASKNKPRGEK